MVKENFLKVVNALISINVETNKLSKLGIDAIESPIISNAEDIAIAFLSEAYNQDGTDWIMWWIYEKDGDPTLQAFDENGNEIIRTIDELYEYVETNNKNV